MKIRSLLIPCLLTVASAAHAASASVEALARPMLTGVQIASTHAERQGKVSAAQKACVMAIKPDALYGAVNEVMTSALTAAERAEADRFFASAVGQKYVKAGVAQLYTVLGEPQPEPAPEVTEADQRAIAAFATTSAGEKMIGGQVMQSASAKQVYGKRIRELVDGCKTK